jgi:hypothetical protein
MLRLCFCQEDKREKSSYPFTVSERIPVPSNSVCRAHVSARARHTYVHYSYSYALHQDNKRQPLSGSSNNQTFQHFSHQHLSPLLLNKAINNYHVQITDSTNVISGPIGSQHKVSARIHKKKTWCRKGRRRSGSNPTSG